MIKIIIILFVLFNSFAVYAADNVGLHKQVVGSFPGDLKKITDGIKNKKNFTTVTSPKNKFVIIVLGNAKYIKRLNIYWVKGYEPEKYRVEYSKSLFDWKSVGVYTVKAKGNKGLIKSTIHVRNVAAFFIKVTILKSRHKEVRISEIELYSATKTKFALKDVKVSNIREHSASISFTTTIPTSGYIRIGESKSGMNKNTGVEIDIFKKHNITVNNLLKGTVYYFQPVATDVNGRIVVGKILKFRTKGIPLPRFSLVNIIPQKYSAVLKLKANIKCKYKVFVGKEINKLKKIFSGTELADGLQIKITGLIPMLKYYIKIIIEDKFANKKDTIVNFFTKEENIALNKKVYGTFFYSYNDKINFNFINLKKITDGNLNISGIALSGNINAKEEKVIVDLGAEYKIKKINVIWRSIAYPEFFDVLAGNDLKKKMRIIKRKIKVEKIGESLLSNGESGLILRLLKIDFNGAKYRYIQIRVHKGIKVKSDLPYKPGNRLDLAEVKVFRVIPRKVDEDYRAIMLTK